MEKIYVKNNISLLISHYEMLTCALEVAELLSAASLSSIPEETVGFTFWEAIITLWNDRIAGLFCENSLSVPL